MKIMKLLLILIISLNLYAATENCNINVNGSIVSGVPISDIVHKNKSAFFTLTIEDTSNVTVNITSLSGPVTSYLRDSCGGTILAQGSGDAVTPISYSTSSTLSAGQYVIEIENPSNIADVSFNITANVTVLPLTVSFAQATYNISEDINTADYVSSAMSLTVTLSRASALDISMHYSTRDGTAIGTASGGTDYGSLSDTLTIPAGSTTATIYLNIVHDPAIELDENFYMDLDTLSPVRSYINFGTSTAEIIILAQNSAPLCYEDDFNSVLDNKWRLLYSQNGTGGATYTPNIVNGRLRMTPATNEISTAVTKDYEFRAAQNLIIVEFDQFAYGSTDNWSANGADGLAVVLYDSAVGASPTPGAFGGSLGYAQKSNPGSDCTVVGGCPGFEGGWLGLGLDEYGNYANPTEGRDGGVGFTPNAVSIRGDGNGTVGYKYLQGTNSLTPALSNKSSAAYSGGRFRMTIDSRDSSHLYISLERDANRDGTYESTIINKFDAKDPLYSQDATPEFVRLSITSSTGGANNIHEIDDLVVHGVCQVYNPFPPTEVASKADIVNNFVNAATYNTGTKYITTKVASKTEQITGVHLDNNGLASTYTSTNANLMFRIIPYLTYDDNPSAKEIVYDTNGNPAVISIVNGQVTGDINIVMPAKANKNAHFIISALDFSEVYANSKDVCLLNSSTTGNLQGLAQCVNSTDNKYHDIFGDSAYQRCAVENGQPCLSQNHGVGTGIYANEYGCLMCTLDANTTRSSDHFAIRPNNFTITTTNSDFPHLLLSGQDYNVTLKAVDYNNNATQDYNIGNAQTVLTFDKIRYFKDGTLDTTNSLNGSISSTTNDYNMTNGVSIKNGNTEVVGFNYNDVGNIDFIVEDRTWSLVDTTDQYHTNDPTTAACPTTSALGGWICGAYNMTLIPDHFTLTDINVTNNNGNPGTYTYISNLIDGDQTTYTMAARVATKIVAKSKLGNITTNFRTGTKYYENPMNVQLSVFHSPIGSANTTSINDVLLGFGKDNNDINGTRTMLWNEADLTKVARFNFPRNIDTAIDPFQVKGNELNITVSSTYTDGANSRVIKDDDSGKGTAGNNATFIYGRTHAPRYRYPSNVGDAIIYFEAYCDVDGNKTLLPNGINSLESVDELDWFQNQNHVIPEDGVIGTVKERKATTRVTLNSLTATNPAIANITYDGTAGNPYKTTMENNPSKWLIYNKYNNTASTNEFDVEFYNPGGKWTGVKNTNTTTDSNASDTTSKRIFW